MKFKSSDLREYEVAWQKQGTRLGGPFEDFEVAENRHIGERRWVSEHELVLRHIPSGLLYHTVYENGLTESQDTKPFDEYYGWPEETEFDLVVAVPVTTYEYQVAG